MNDERLLVVGIVVVGIVIALAWDWYDTRQQRWKETPPARQDQLPGDKS